MKPDPASGAPKNTSEAPAMVIACEDSWEELRCGPGNTDCDVVRRESDAEFDAGLFGDRLVDASLFMNDVFLNKEEKLNNAAMQFPPLAKYKDAIDGGGTDQVGGMSLFFTILTSQVA